MDEILGCGIYVIINKKLNIVYVGQTRENFLIRWLEHLRRIEKYEGDLYRLRLYLDKDTRYLVIKEMTRENSDVIDFDRFENEAKDFYIERGWLVVSEHHADRKKEGTLHEEDNSKRYKLMLQHMIQFLGSVNVKQNYVGRLYGQVYRKINKDFTTDVHQRAEGNNVIGVLTKEELKSAILNLYPRYKAKKLDIHRKEYKEWF